MPPVPWLQSLGPGRGSARWVLVYGEKVAHETWANAAALVCHRGLAPQSWSLGSAHVQKIHPCWGLHGNTVSTGCCGGHPGGA